MKPIAFTDKLISWVKLSKKKFFYKYRRWPKIFKRQQWAKMTPLVHVNIYTERMNSLNFQLLSIPIFCRFYLYFFTLNPLTFNFYGFFSHSTRVSGEDDLVSNNSLPLWISFSGKGLMTTWRSKTHKRDKKLWPCTSDPK